MLGMSLLCFFSLLLCFQAILMNLTNYAEGNGPLCSFMLQFLSLKYTKRIQHPCSHYTQHIIYCTSYIHIVIPQGRLAGLLVLVRSAAALNRVAVGLVMTKQEPTVNSSVSELEDPEADDQVVSLLSKLRAPRQQSTAP